MFENQVVGFFSLRKMIHECRLHMSMAGEGFRMEMMTFVYSNESPKLLVGDARTL